MLQQKKKELPVCQILYHKILWFYFIFFIFYEKKRKTNKCPWNIFCAAKKKNVKAFW